MKKNLWFAASLLAVSGLVAACGTSETAEDQAETTETTDTAEEALEEVTEDVPAEETTEEDTEGNGAGTDTEEAPETSPSSIQNEGTLTQSDEQGYELYVLPGYELTSEEPNKDSLYATEDESVFMRIETFTPDELDFASAEEVMQQTLQAVNPDAEVVQGQQLDAPEILNSSIYEVDSAEGKVTGITYEKENIIVRLTIFDNNELNATEDFKNMGQTVEPTE